MNLDKITLELYEEALTASLNRGSEQMRPDELTRYLSENIADLLGAEGEQNVNKERVKNALTDIMRDRADGETMSGIEFLKSPQAAVKALRFKLSMTLTLNKLPSLGEVGSSRAEFTRKDDAE